MTMTTSRVTKIHTGLHCEYLLSLNMPLAHHLSASINWQVHKTVPSRSPRFIFVTPHLFILASPCCIFDELDLSIDWLSWLILSLLVSHKYQRDSTLYSSGISTRRETMFFCRRLSSSDVGFLCHERMHAQIDNYICWPSVADLTLHFLCWLSAADLWYIIGMTVPSRYSIALPIS